MSDNDLLYYLRRVDQELEQAQRAACPEAVRAHYILANFYLDKLQPPAVKRATAH